MLNGNHGNKERLVEGAMEWDLVLATSYLLLSHAPLTLCWIYSHLSKLKIKNKRSIYCRLFISIYYFL